MRRRKKIGEAKLTKCSKNSNFWEESKLHHGALTFNPTALLQWLPGTLFGYSHLWENFKTICFVYKFPLAKNTWYWKHCTGVSVDECLLGKGLWTGSWTAHFCVQSGSYFFLQPVKNLSPISCSQTTLCAPACLVAYVQQNAHIYYLVNENHCVVQLWLHLATTFWFLFFCTK